MIKYLPKEGNSILSKVWQRVHLSWEGTTTNFHGWIDAHRSYKKRIFHYLTTINTFYQYRRMNCLIFFFTAIFASSIRVRRDTLGQNRLGNGRLRHMFGRHRSTAHMKLPSIENQIGSWLGTLDMMNHSDQQIVKQFISAMQKGKTTKTQNRRLRLFNTNGKRFYPQHWRAIGLDLVHIQF